MREKTSPEVVYGSMIEQLHSVAMFVRATKHKLRQQIIELLRENKRMVVTDLYVKLRLEQSVASQHLKILRKVGVVYTERNGKFIYYAVDEDKEAEVLVLIEELNNVIVKPRKKK